MSGRSGGNELRIIWWRQDCFIKGAPAYLLPIPRRRLLLARTVRGGWTSFPELFLLDIVEEELSSKMMQDQETIFSSRLFEYEPFCLVFHFSTRHCSECMLDQPSYFSAFCGQHIAREAEYYGFGWMGLSVTRGDPMSDEERYAMLDHAFEKEEELFWDSADI